MFLFQNLYDRVAGDDIDTGDELEAFEHSNKEKNSINVYYEPPHLKKPQRIANDDTSKEHLITHSNIKPKNSDVRKEESRDNLTQADHRENSYSTEDVEEEKVVMRITPRPPMRKRPKSTPVLDHVTNQLSQMMEDKMR